MVLAPIDWIKTIDKETNLALQKNLSRFSLEWGMWSSVMNRYIQERVKANDPDSDKYKFVFAYWISMSQCVEMAHRKSKGFMINEKKFVEEVAHIEAMKEAIKQDKWSLV